MADPNEFITARHKTTGEERPVARGALEAGFWPEYEPADAKKSASTARSEKKD